MAFRITSNVKGEVLNFGNMIKWFQFTVKDLTENQAEWGAQFAKSIAPGSGELIQAISSQPDSSGKGYSWMVVSRLPKNQTSMFGGTKRIPPVPYHKFLHEGKRGGYHGSTKTGDHKYMFTLTDVMRKGFSVKIEKSIEKALKGKTKIKQL